MHFIIIMVKIKRVVSFFFVALFISYYASSTLFSHTHTISGATIFHSHFHTNSHHDTKSDGHTENSITLIAQTSHFDYINFSPYCIPQPSQFLLYENKCVETMYRITSIYLKNLTLRAPPIV